MLPVMSLQNVLRKGVFTTGEVAKVCSVAARTVSKWFDSGKLVGYRIPCSNDRRIPLEEVMAFLRRNQMPIPQLMEEYEKSPSGGCVVFSLPGEYKALLSPLGFRIEVVEDLFSAGRLIGEGTWTTMMILNLTAGKDACSLLLDVAKGLRIPTLVIASEDYSQERVVEFLAKRKSEYLIHPFSSRLLIETVARLQLGYLRARIKHRPVVAAPADEIAPMLLSMEEAAG